MILIIPFDEEMFESLYREYYLQIYKYCLSRLKCDTESAEDAVQETFLVLYNALLKGEEIDNTKAYLYTVATNFIKKRYNEIQKSNERLASLDDVENIADASLSDLIIKKISFEEFEKALDSILSEEEKSLYNLRYVEEERVKDIAEKLNIEEHHCAVKISRLRKKIIDTLSEYY